MKNRDFLKKNDQLWLSNNNRSDMYIFQNFCCCILRLYISPIKQHKKFPCNGLLSIFIFFFSYR